MVAYNCIHCGTIGDSEKTVESLHIIIKLRLWAPFAFIKEVTCSKMIDFSNQSQTYSCENVICTLACFKWLLCKLYLSIHYLPKTNTSSGWCKVMAVWKARCICHSLLHLSNQWPLREPNRWVSAITIAYTGSRSSDFLLLRAGHPHCN